MLVAIFKSDPSNTNNSPFDFKGVFYDLSF